MDVNHQKKLSPFEKKQQQHEKIFKKWIIGNWLIVIPALIFSWKLGVILVALSLYCWEWFYEGYKSQVVDEWEIGYFSEGRKYLYKGLVILAILAAIAFSVYFIFVR